MGALSVNCISKKYEELHKQFIDLSSEDESFYALNNAMIFAYFVKLLGLDYSRSTQKECLEDITNTYGTEIFFHNVKKTEQYRRNRDLAIDSFIELFSNDAKENHHLESVLGNVLEKHVNRKDTGSYYTPFDTTQYISRNAIIISVLKNLKSELKNRILEILSVEEPEHVLNCNSDIIQLLSQQQWSENEKHELTKCIYRQRIIDPTCGSGAFVIAAFEVLESLIESFNEKVDYDQLLKCLYGLDISKEAIQLTKIRLLIRLATKECNLKDFSRNFDNRFRIADALKGSDYVIEEPGFDWKSFGMQFDCVIGNPPYIESKGYVSDNFETKNCGNLYAYVIERACNIVKSNGVISFIVPLPLVATPRMQKVKNYLENCSTHVFYGTYADRPGCIFTGVHQRLVIFFASIGNTEKKKVFSSSYNYWYNNERADLFTNVKYYHNEYKGILPKIGNTVEESIYRKLTNSDNTLFDLWCEKSAFPLYLSTRIGFWAKAFDKNVFDSKEFKEYFAKDPQALYLSLAILNSSTFYFLWVILSDCWHITNKNIMDFTFDMSKIVLLDHSRIKQLVSELMNDLERNKEFIGSKQTNYEYKHKYSKKIIDAIDDTLRVLFDFSTDEVAYIKRFTEKYRVNNMETENMNVIDLFAGVGGLSVGFRKAGYNILLANEIDKDISSSYTKNHPDTVMINDDIKNLLPVVKPYRGKVDVIIGGPPCQGFSMAGARIRTNKGSAFLDDPRNYLFRHYFAIVQELEPSFFVMENVPGMLSMQGGKIIEEIESLFSDENNFKNGKYYLYKRVLNAYDYGVPQERHRLIIFGSKKNLDFEKLFEEVRAAMVVSGEIKPHTIEDAISDLNWLESGEGAFVQDYRYPAKTEYQKERRANSNKLYNHIATKHNDVAIARINELKPGGRRLDLTEGENIKSVHSGAYGRMRWDDVSKTIITRFDTPSSGVYIHPERARTITPREAARIQSFDDDFVFYGNKSSVIKQIGNAVPPLLAYYLAKVIKKGSEKQ